MSNDVERAELMVATSDGSELAGAARTVMVCLLGGFRILRPDGIRHVPPDSKAGLLLRQLALSGSAGVAREELMRLLWADGDDAALSRCLNTLITEVRGFLRVRSDDVLPIANGDGCYRFNPAAGVTVDVQCFDAFVDRGHRAAAAGRHATALKCYEQAIGLYRGDLFLGRVLRDEVNAFVEQERVRSRYMTALARAASLALGEGDRDGSMSHARRLLSMNPCSEVGHRLVMHVYALEGRREQSLRQYRVCAEAMHREYDTEPEMATVALFDLIRHGTWDVNVGSALIGARPS